MAQKLGNAGSFAETTIHDAWLFTEWGEAYARKVFGDALVDALPKYGKRSSHAGRPMGKLTWRKVIKGGWLHGVGVVAPGTTYAHGIWEMPWNGEPKLAHGVDTYSNESASGALAEGRTSAKYPPVDWMAQAVEAKARWMAATALLAEYEALCASDRSLFNVHVQNSLQREVERTLVCWQDAQRNIQES